MLSLNIHVELSSIIRHDNKQKAFILQHGVRSKNIVSTGRLKQEGKRQTHCKQSQKIRKIRYHKNQVSQRQTNKQCKKNGKQ